MLTQKPSGLWIWPQSPALEGRLARKPKGAQGLGKFVRACFNHATYNSVLILTKLGDYNSPY